MKKVKFIFIIFMMIFLIVGGYGISFCIIYNEYLSSSFNEIFIKEFNMNNYSDRFDWVSIYVNDVCLYTYTIITNFEDSTKMKFSITNKINDIYKRIKYNDGLIKLENDTFINGTYDDFINMTYKFNLDFSKSNFSSTTRNMSLNKEKNIIDVNYDFYDDYKTRLYIPLLDIDYELESISVDYFFRISEYKKIEDIENSGIDITFFINAISNENKIKLLYFHSVHQNEFSDWL